MKQYVYLAGGVVMVVLGLSMAITNQFMNQGQESLDANLAELTEEPTMASERPIIKFETTKGDITVELFEDKSPNTVGYILGFVEQGYYDGTQFHRVISDFMIQGGDPLTKDPAAKARYGTGGPDFEFADEFNNEPLVRGSVAMANAGPNTNGSQFFIVTAEATPWLDGAHTNFGRVLEGMEVVEAIEAVETDARDLPLEPVVVETVSVVRK